MTRRITHVADGTAATDAATVGQLQSASASLHQNIRSLGTEIDQVGAVSAALAGLHPLQSDKGFEISAAGGAYDGKQAMALGGFYHANPDLLFSFGAATSFDGDHKTAGNVGVTFRVGPKAEKNTSVDIRTSDEVLQRLDALSRKVDKLEAENQDLKNKLNIK